MEISATLVKELREKTSLGLMDCKRALKETNGNIKEAIIFLKEKGMIKAAQKSTRSAKEGIIKIAQDNNAGIVVEINCETDFVARTPDFLNLSEEITKGLLKARTKDINNIPDEIATRLKGLIVKLGENMLISRISLVNKDSLEYFSSYIHGSKIGVLLKLKVSNAQTMQNSTFLSLSRDICMHIAAMSPAGITENDIDKEAREEQKSIFTKQAKETNKPDNIIEKIVLGKMNQYLKEITLINQAFVKEQKKTIKEVLSEHAKALNDSIKITSFVRFNVGE